MRDRAWPVRTPRPRGQQATTHTEVHMAVAVTKGQTSTSDHRSSRLQEMSWNDIQRPGSYLILRVWRSRASAARCVGARTLALDYDHLDWRDARRQTIGQPGRADLGAARVRRRQRLFRQLLTANRIAARCVSRRANPLIALLTGVVPGRNTHRGRGSRVPAPSHAVVFARTWSKVAALTRRFRESHRPKCRPIL